MRPCAPPAPLSRPRPDPHADEIPMTDNQQPGGDRPVYQPVPPRAPRPRGGGRPLYWLVVVVLLAGVGYGTWRAVRWTTAAFDASSTQQELIQRLSREVGELRAQAQDLSTRQTDLTAAVRRTGSDVASLSGRIEGGEQAMARLSDTVEGGR